MGDSVLRAVANEAGTGYHLEPEPDITAREILDEMLGPELEAMGRVLLNGQKKHDSAWLDQDHGTHLHHAFGHIQSADFAPDTPDDDGEADEAHAAVRCLMALNRRLAGQ